MRLTLAAFLFLVTFVPAAQAYIGPGLGAGTIGVVLGVAGSIVLALFAVVWYPVKRLIKGKKKPAPAVEPGEPATTDRPE